MKTWILVSLMAAGFCSGCDTFATSTGEHNQPCFGDGTCLEGLICDSASDTCILPEEDCDDRECGPSPNLGNDCGTCSGMTDYCAAGGQCEDDCAGRVCGQSPNGGFDCGTCSGALEVCVSGKCNILEWQDPPSIEMMNWHVAIATCDSLSLDGNSDWHLPSVNELRAFVRGCLVTGTGGTCGVTDVCLTTGECWNSFCFGCEIGQGPAGNCYWSAGMSGECLVYWSSSPGEDLVNSAWAVNFSSGSVGKIGTGIDARVRCVRHGD